MEAHERVEEEEIWSWGAGTDGQLATGNRQDEYLPRLLPIHPSLSFLSCGGGHVIAITPTNKTYTWGRGTSGQLGHGNLLNTLQPKSVDVLDNLNIINVSAGWNHSGFVSECGQLFTCGDGSFGQLGLGNYISQNLPINVPHFASRHVEQIACGMRHSLVLLKGEHREHVYAFGSGKRGQLGISNQKVKSVNLPQSVFGLNDVNVTSICANGDHSAALSSGGPLFSWGRGFGGTQDVCYANRVISPFSFTQVALGWNHALLLTDGGDVLMLGCHQGLLNNSQKENFATQDLTKNRLEKVCGLDGIKVVGIASGSEHCVLTTENGMVMTWGWGEHGQLGLGDASDQTRPQLVSMPQNVTHEHIMSNVYCGSGFTFSVRIRRAN